MESRLFSLVMPVGPGSEKSVKGAIESILSQDEEDFDVICVINGQWEGREKAGKIIRQLAKKDKRIYLAGLDEGNVCTARNAGAEMAIGKYISFFSSDFVMYPGALTKWKKAFEDNPEADFVYSGYALMENGKPVNGFCPSRDFDPYLLETSNYIDGGFPMKREVWEKGKWDVNCKSLNDWDFWLTAVKNGFKGKMIADPTYMAEVPKQGGLSFDSHQNWLERTDYIKKKHGIPERDICVVSLGAAPHGIKMAKILNADFQVHPMGKPNRYKAIYVIGFYFGNGDSALAHTNIFKGFKGKQIIHWIGTDIFQFIGAGYKVCYNDMKFFIDELEKRKNLTEFEQTHGELASMGITSDIVPLPIETNIELMPLPKDFTVAVYVPNTPTAKQIYNLDLATDIIKSCPDINFLLFGGGSLDSVGTNVRNVGWRDMKSVMADSSMLMRLTFHDGLPITPIEFRLAGRDAMTTVQMKHIWFAGDGVINKDNYAKKKEGIIAMLRDIKKTQKKSGVRDVEEARQYYLELTDPKKYREAIRKIVDL